MVIPLNSEPVPQNFSDSERSPSQFWLALLSVVLGLIMFTLDSSTVNIALPTITKTFDTHLAVAQWVIISYLIVLTTLIFSVACLGNMLGRRKLFQAGLMLFTISSLLCGLAPGIVWLIGFRVLQGCGAVLIVGLGMAMITELFAHSPQYGLALSLAVMTLSVTYVLGPAIGGLLVTLSDWRAIFLINLPIGIIAILLFAWCVPPSHNTRSEQDKFDTLGTIMLALVMVNFALAMSEGQKQGFNSAIALILLTTTIIGLIVFVLVESQIRQPMIDLSLFRNRILSINLLTMVVVYIVMAFRLLIYPFFLELVLQYPTDQVGMLMITLPITNAIIAPISRRLVDKFGSHRLIPIGLMLLAFGCMLASTFSTQLTPLGYVLTDIAMGAGLAMWRSPNNVATMRITPHNKIGVVSGLLNESSLIGQTLGIPLGSAIFITLALSSINLPHTTPLASMPLPALEFAMHRTFLTLAVFLGIFLVVNLLFQKTPILPSNNPEALIS
ncbi:MFS transporter [Fischerella muscicola CCMEE 5323]|uniref:MFS transporter n=1 Tax=Fischerella muscicola CCMEE 5323 TaxID=2019572 RepID=A0A2N6K7T6_FISMU|nr:DHA2 family efflux MFS transporter permease subunit [Fischerella sp. FACHB-380]PLZ93509.1 MFS transporter [Fischerella muscicola CCMEE 5323]